MKKSKDEYLMLREEILHLDNIINNIINFFYVFVSAILTYSVTQNDTKIMLISYLVIIPAYRIVLGKRKNIFRIAGYLYVFHEGKDFNWERRQKKYFEIEKSKYGVSKKINSFNYPFLFVSTFVTIMFLLKTNWCNIEMTEEFIVILFALILYIIQLIAIFKNKIITMDDYEKDWEYVKKTE